MLVDGEGGWRGVNSQPVLVQRDDIMALAHAPELEPVEEAPRLTRPGFERDPMSVRPSDDVPDDLQRHDRIGIMYQSGASRAESLARRAILNGQARERFEPPPPPPGAGKVWEAQALRARHAFLAEKSALSRTFTAQATSREWAAIELRLRRTRSALEAVAILGEMQAFLMTDPLITRLDAAASLGLLSRVRLPFERLVRNVWEEGDEVRYDRAKAAVCALLAAEVAERARQASAGWQRAAFGPRGECGQLVHNLELQAARRQAARAAEREAARPKFRGMKVARQKPTSVQADQRALLAAFSAS